MAPAKTSFNTFTNAPTPPHTDRQTDRQTEKQTDRQTDTHTHTHTHRTLKIPFLPKKILHAKKSLLHVKYLC